MRLPPLNALRAFEAAARHNGFVAASEELNVTRGAISRHIKLLEEHLGTPLFRRNAKGVDLTDAGKRLLPVLSDAFEKIAREATRLSSSASDLRIICPPATSIRWLIPKLESFRQKHPDIRVRLTTEFHSKLGMDVSDYDIGFSVENWPERIDNMEMQALFPIVLTPACRPGILSGATPLASPADLVNVTLLHETPRHEDWTAWLAHFPVDGVNPNDGDEFPNLDIAAKAAIMGAGVVMADLVLCREELASGSLVAPFPELTCGSPYGSVCLLGPRDKWHAPKVKAFRDWAMEASEGDRDLVRTSPARSASTPPSHSR